MTYYYWDEVNDNLFGEEDENGEVTASYTHEPGLYGELIAQERDGETRYYNYDGLGNTSELTDENENVTDIYEYSAFGEEVTRTGTTENPFGYKGALGYYTNGETNDVYVRARTYAPAIARWMSQDPFGFLDGPQRYAYVVNNPIAFGDPTGTVKAILFQEVIHKGCSGCGNFEWDVHVSVTGVTGHPDARESQWVLVQRICFDRTHEYCLDEGCGCSPTGRTSKLECCHNEFLAHVYIKANAATVVSVGKIKPFVTDEWQFLGGGDGDCHSKGTGKIRSELYLVPGTDEYDKINETNAPFDLPCGDRFTVKVGKGPVTIATGGAIGHSSASVTAKWNCCPKAPNHCSSGSISLGD